MNNYTESKQKLNSIREKYGGTGELIFKTAIQYVVEYGSCTLLDKEWQDWTMNDIDARHDRAEAIDKVMWCTRDFEKAIYNCAIELAAINTYDLLIYIQREVWLGGGEIGQPDYQRAIKLIHECINWIETSSTSTYDLHDTLTNWCDFHEDEIEYLGYGYLLDYEEDEEDEE